MRNISWRILCGTGGSGDSDIWSRARAAELGEVVWSPGRYNIDSVLYALTLPMTNRSSPSPQYCQAKYSAAHLFLSLLFFSSLLALAAPDPTPEGRECDAHLPTAVISPHLSSYKMRCNMSIAQSVTIFSILYEAKNVNQYCRESILTDARNVAARVNPIADTTSRRRAMTVVHCMILAGDNGDGVSRRLASTATILRRPDMVMGSSSSADNGVDMMINAHHRHRAPGGEHLPLKAL